MQHKQVQEPKYGQFPDIRLRRNRSSEWMRRLVRENTLSMDDLIMVAFVRDQNAPADIPSMPGTKRYTVSEIIDFVGQVDEAKVPALHLFPYYEKESRDSNVLNMLHHENMYCEAISQIKKHFPHLGVIADVALDVYAPHGQDGLVKDGKILNDETVDVISNYAVTLADAGADVIAPSEMMDGRISGIRRSLDQAGFQDTGIMSYAAKYASNFYGPFRDAVGSKNCLGEADKRTYQMDYGNSYEALREVSLDLNEGADSVMVKPALPYLDVVKHVKDTFQVPTFAFHVSGEYAMLKAAAEKGWLDYDSCLIEALTAMKRAGADGILTYTALEVAEILRQGE